MKVKNISTEVAYAKRELETWKEKLAAIPEKRSWLKDMTKIEADSYGEKLDAQEAKATRLVDTFERLSNPVKNKKIK